MNGVMQYWDVWVVILGLTGVTFFTRTFFMLIGAKIPLPRAFQRAIRYAPAAALVAIIVPEMLPFDPSMPELGFDWLSPKTWGGLAALAAYFYSRHILVTLAVGLSVFTLLRLFH